MGKGACTRAEGARWPAQGHVFRPLCGLQGRIGRGWAGLVCLKTALIPSAGARGRHCAWVTRERLVVSGPVSFAISCGNPATGSVVMSM